MFTQPLMAHDEGHGPAIKDESHHGGKVSAIILSADVNKGRGAKMLYKGELVHSSRKLDVQLYLYDKNMKPVDLKGFVASGRAVQIERRAKGNFTLTLDKSGKFFKGTRPKNKRVPFNIDVFVKDGKRELFGAFDRLD
jgi:hypothetical protein